MSEDAKDLIKKLLAMKPSERFCAAQDRQDVKVTCFHVMKRFLLHESGSSPVEQALNHIWIKEKAPHSRKEPLNTTSVGCPSCASSIARTSGPLWYRGVEPEELQVNQQVQVTRMDLRAGTCGKEDGATSHRARRSDAF